MHVLSSLLIINHLTFRRSVFLAIGIAIKNTKSKYNSHDIAPKQKGNFKFMMQLGLILQLTTKTRYYRVCRPYRIYERYWCPSCTFVYHTILPLTTRIQYHITPTVHCKYGQGQATLVDNAVRSIEDGAVFLSLQDVTRRTRSLCFIRVTIRKQGTTVITCTH